MHQLSVIIKTLGSPPIDKLGFEVQKITERTINIARSHPPIGIKRILPKETSIDAIDLIHKMLVVNPDERITAEEAMNHPYLADIHTHMKKVDSLDNINKNNVPSLFDSDFEAWAARGSDSPTYTQDLLKSLMHEEISSLQRSIVNC